MGRILVWIASFNSRVFPRVPMKSTIRVNITETPFGELAERTKDLRVLEKATKNLVGHSHAIPMHILWSVPNSGASSVASVALENFLLNPEQKRGRLSLSFPRCRLQ